MSMLPDSVTLIPVEAIHHRFRIVVPATMQNSRWLGNPTHHSRQKKHVSRYTLTYNSIQHSCISVRLFLRSKHYPSVQLGVPSYL